MRILCFDQATKISGYSLWDDGELIDHGVIDIKAGRTESSNSRIRRMGCELTHLISEKNPDVVVMEQTQYQQNAVGFRVLCQMQGYMMSELDRMKLEFCFVEPASWRKWCGVTGRKREEQKQSAMRIAKEKYGIENVTEDEADAIGIGLWAVLHTVEERK